MTEQLSAIKELSQHGDIDAARRQAEREAARATMTGQGRPGQAAISPMTVTEAFQDLHKQQNQIKAALDRLIDDATTLRAQL